MLYIIKIYWTYIFAILSIFFGLFASIHATMTKEEVRTAIGWVGIIILSPFLGAFIYCIIGINRIRRKYIIVKRKKSKISKFHMKYYDVTYEEIKNKFDNIGILIKNIGDNITCYKQTKGNNIQILKGGDKAYNIMLKYINNAKKSIFLETYIFDYDEIGKKFVKALSYAVNRGLTVRVLIDAVGARYSFPSIVYYLRKKKVPVYLFNGNIIIGLRLPYSNLRTHRKILIIDGKYAFTGGMNIRSRYSYLYCKDKVFYDTHFFIQGPSVQDLFYVLSEDLMFSCKEKLNFNSRYCASSVIKCKKGLIARIIPSGPDERSMELNQRILIGACSIARNRILIKTPYLLPDREFISALATAARRGVKVNIVIPGKNNLKLVDMAMHAQFDQLLKENCRIWRTYGPFDHSKLFLIDDFWSYVGSSNIDPRSLRLNFEIDLEIMDKFFTKKIAKEIYKSIKKAKEVKLRQLAKKRFFTRLLNKIVWLGSPYL